MIIPNSEPAFRSCKTQMLHTEFEHSGSVVPRSKTCGGEKTRAGPHLDDKLANGFACLLLCGSPIAPSYALSPLIQGGSKALFGFSQGTS